MDDKIYILIEEYDHYHDEGYMDTSHVIHGVSFHKEKLESMLADLVKIDEHNMFNEENDTNIGVGIAEAKGEWDSLEYFVLEHRLI